MNKILNITKILLLFCLAEISITSCSTTFTEPVGNEPILDPTNVPPKSDDSFEARKVVLYYQSHSRYQGLYAHDVLSNPDYKHDIFAPSFAIIGDGNTAIGNETSAWKNNQLGYDDIWAWSGLIWSDDHKLHFADGRSIGTDNINKGLNDNPDIPYTIAIGGWPANDDPNDPLRTGGFDKIGFSDPDLEEFVENVKNNTTLAGRVVRPPNEITLDYEFPVTTLQGTFFTRIVKKFHEKTSDKFIINIAVGPNNAKHLDMLSFPDLDNYVDSFEIMTYDYHGKWDNMTGHHTGLYGNTNGVENSAAFKDYYNVDSQVQYLLDKGIAASKIKIGIALYGRFWTGVQFPETIDPTQPHFPVYGGALPSGMVADKWTSAGTILYGDAMTEVTTAKGWEYFSDPIAKATFAIHREKKMFVTLDDINSIKAKATYIKEKGLGGVIVWDALGAKGTSIMALISSEVH